LLNLQGIDRNSVNVVATRQLKQQPADLQRDVYDSHRHRVFALAFYMTGNEIEAETILTSTFVAAFRETEVPQADHVDSALVAELRRRFPLTESEPTANLNGAVGPHLAERNVRRTDLEEAIQTLPATERLLFLLRDVEGYSPSVISRLLQMQEAKVQRGLFSARIRLRQALASSAAEEREAA
jgi:RNA polymerase sigma-70 factor (ECF subfamily)